MLERLIPVLIFCLFHMSMNQSIDRSMKPRLDDDDLF